MNMIKGCFLGFSLLIGASANAAIINFDFTGDSQNRIYDTLSFSSGGYTLNVTARTRITATAQDGSKTVTNQDSKVEWWREGLGVVTEGNADNRLNSDTSIDEKLLFTLTSAGDPAAKFTWIEVFFGTRNSSRLETGETAEIRFGSPESEYFVRGPLSSYVIDDLSKAWNKFNLESSERNIDDNGFRVKGVSIDVPAPSTSAILGLGLLALGMRRFKKAA